MVLPGVIESVVNTAEVRIPNDTVMKELENIASTQGVSIAMAIYMLGFSSYNGFRR